MNMSEQKTENLNINLLLQAPRSKHGKVAGKQLHVNISAPLWRLIRNIVDVLDNSTERKITLSDFVRDTLTSRALELSTILTSGGSE